MRDIDIKQLLQKSQELKALFVLGQRVIPFLEEMFRFIEEISPILDVINTSIEDNLQKMPKASMQLSKVSEATELATTEILDTLDGLVLKSNTISTNLRKLDGQNATPTGETETLVADSEGLLNSIREDANTIIMALQIQDITSQQLAAVNHLLETVQKRLSEIMKEFRDPEFEPLLHNPGTSSQSPTNVSQLHRHIAFDTNAIDSLNKEHGTARQDHVDSIFNNPAANQPRGAANTVSSQDDIDALFGAPAQTTNNAVSSQDDIDALFGAPAQTGNSESSSVSSQDDIDALFGAPAQTDNSESSSVSSQDDIDALFGTTGQPPRAEAPAEPQKPEPVPQKPASTPQTSTPKNAQKANPHSDSGGVSQDDIDALFNNPT